MKSHTNTRPFKHKRNKTCPSLLIPNVYLKSILTLDSHEKQEIENLINTDEVEETQNKSKSIYAKDEKKIISLENIL